MRKNKIFCIIFACALVLSFDASAGWKNAVGDWFSKVGKSIENVAENVTKKVNNAAEKVKAKIMGSPAVVAYEKAKAAVGEIQNEVEAGKELYEDSKNTVEAGKQAVSDVKKAGSEVEEKYKNSSTVKTADIQKEIDEINRQMEDRKSVLATEANARLKNAKENAKVAQSLGAGHDLGYDPEEALKEQQEKVNLLNDDPEQFYATDSAYQDLIGKLKEKEAELEQAKADLASEGMGAAQEGADKVMSMLEGKQEAQQKNKEYAESNYLKEGEDYTFEAHERIKQNRKVAFKMDLAHTASTYINARKNLQKIEEDEKTLVHNMKEFDTLISRKSFQAQQVVDEIKIVRQAMAVDMVYLKLKTTLYLQAHGAENLNAGEDMTKVNLKELGVREEDKKKNLMKEVQEKAEDIKGKADKVKNKATEVKNKAEGYYKQGKEALEEGKEIMGVIKETTGAGQ